MRLFERKARPVSAPKRLLWSESLWREATGANVGERFHALVMVRTVRTKAGWRYGARKLGIDTEYVGRLGCEPGSMVEHVSASVIFDTDPNAPRDRHAWPDSLGLAYTNEYDHGGGAFPIFVVKVWSDEAGEQVFERAFDRALAAGHDHLPVWIDGVRRADPVPGVERYSVIQPLASIWFEQGVVLGSARSVVR